MAYRSLSDSGGRICVEGRVLWARVYDELDRRHRTQEQRVNVAVSKIIYSGKKRNYLRIKANFPKARSFTPCISATISMFYVAHPTTLPTSLASSPQARTRTYSTQQVAEPASSFAVEDGVDGRTHRVYFCEEHRVVIFCAIFSCYSESGGWGRG